MAQEILQTMGFRSFTPMVIAAPRSHHQRLPTPGTRHPSIFTRTNAGLENQIQSGKHGSRRHGVRREWPGESKNANIGISSPGSGESPVAPVYEDGVKTVTLKGDNIAAEFQTLVEKYIESHYGAH